MFNKKEENFIMGSIAMPAQKKPIPIVELAKRISDLEIDQKLKDFLLVVSYNQSPDDVCSILRFVEQSGEFHFPITDNEIIKEKIDELKDLPREELIGFAKELVEKIDTGEINIFDE